MDEKFTIIGLGELLWDIFPYGKKLGGAPANFTYHVSALGHNGIIVSRVGNDELGKEIIEKISDTKLNIGYIQTDKIHPTGTVEVIIDSNNQPDYIIRERVAWDFIEWQHSFSRLLGSAVAICFGSLAQRNDISRKTILEMLKKSRKVTEIVFDINLRQDYYDRNIIEDSLRLATILKLNNLELEVIKGLFGIVDKCSQEKFCHLLLNKYDLKLICLTKGEEGSILVNKTSTCRGDIFPYKVADRVGAGDAFAAAMIIEFLKGSSLEKISYKANRLASWVTSKEGGMPAYDDNPLV
jgi:fructokinase